VRAVAFDLRTLAPAGSPVPVFDPVFDASNSGGSYFAVSDTGTFVYVPGGVDFSLVWVDRAGTATALTQERKGYRFPVLSPDERQVAVTVDPADQGNSDIWIYDASGGGGRRLTLDGHNIHPVWTHDGSRVAYSRGGVFWQPADGTGDVTQRDIVGRSPSLVIPRAFTPNGGWLVFGLQDPETGWDLGVVSVEGDETPRLVASSPFREDGGELSPDGRWLAFTSDESGRSEVYVQAFPETAGRILVSSPGGTQPVWSGSGREIFYRNGAQMMAVPVRAGDTFQAGAPTVLFENASLVGSGGEPRFDVTRDGKRFVMVRDNTRVQGGLIHVVQNWDQELKRLVPGD
jgi:Tol biopolymer transport system component